MTNEFKIGSHIILQATSTVDGIVGNVSLMTISITNPAGTKVVDGVKMTKYSDGIYRYKFYISSTMSKGTYSVQYIGTKSLSTGTLTDSFKVI